MRRAALPRWEIASFSSSGKLGHGLPGPRHEEQRIVAEAVLPPRRIRDGPVHGFLGDDESALFEQQDEAAHEPRRAVREPFHPVEKVGVALRGASRSTPPAPEPYREEKIPGSPPRALTHSPESSAITGLWAAWKSAMALPKALARKVSPSSSKSNSTPMSPRRHDAHARKQADELLALVLVVRREEKLVFHHANLRLSGSYTDASFLFNQ